MGDRTSASADAARARAVLSSDASARRRTVAAVRAVVTRTMAEEAASTRRRAIHKRLAGPADRASALQAARTLGESPPEQALKVGGRETGENDVASGGDRHSEPAGRTPLHPAL